MEPLTDIAWCLASEPLMAAQAHDSMVYPDSAWFRALLHPDDARGELDMSTLDITVTARRLGIRFEQLIQGWLEADPRFTLLAHNLPVRDESRTLGEFDLLVAHDGVTAHWELACKFYLGTRDQRDPGNWHGPNPTDTLATKIAHLENHQLQLSDQPAAAALLNARGWQVQQRLAFIKGRLFHPFERYIKQDIEIPANVNPNHERGWWMPVEDFSAAQFPASQFVVLDKPRWLAPFSGVTEAGVTDTLDAEGILSAWEDKPTTLHLAVIDTSGAETSRGFLVSHDWLSEAGVEG